MAYHCLVFSLFEYLLQGRKEMLLAKGFGCLILIDKLLTHRRKGNLYMYWPEPRLILGELAFTHVITVS